MGKLSIAMEIIQPHCGDSHQNGIHCKLLAVLQLLRWIIVKETAPRQAHEDTRHTHTQPGYVKQDFHSNTKPFRFPYTFRFTSDSSRFTINDLVLSETSQPDSLPFRGPAATALYGKSCHTYWRIMEDLQQ